jgi:hypothetical protein
VELRFVPPELRKLDEVGTEVLACGLFSDERPPHGTLGLVDWRLAGQVSRLLSRGWVRGARGEVVMMPLRPKLPFDKVIVFGLGDRASFDEAAFRATIESMLATMEGLSARSAVVELPGRHVGALTAEHAADILLETAAGHPEHDVWTLVERPEDQKRVTAHMIEQRRRVRRLAPGEGA